MTTCVFTGPSLDNSVRARFESSLTFLPPASAGDIQRAADDGVGRIVLIDGLFRNTRSPWHQEILHALSNSIAVIGCCSLGALRAAELYDYGMSYFGEIAHRYVRGRKTLLSDLNAISNDPLDDWVKRTIDSKVLTDDDDVAVIHAPRELGYQPLTVPMVNIVFTLEDAIKSQQINYRQQVHGLRLAKRIHFSNRTTKELSLRLHVDDNSDLTDGELDGLGNLLESGISNFKTEEAERLLTCLACDELSAVKTATDLKPAPRGARWFDNYL